MKRESYLLLVTVLLAIFSNVYSETCSAGMRKTYIDETNTNILGAARRIPLSIAYYEDQGGAVWFYRKILLEPRLEVHLKVTNNGLTKDQDDWQGIIDGFTIVLSKNNNKIGYPYGAINYQGFTDSYVVETDLYYNSNHGDLSANTVSLHKCFGSEVCSCYENSNTKQVNLQNQIYNPKIVQTFDIRFFYDSGVVTVYSGEQKILTENINLVEKFGGAESIYLGFTGFIRGNRKELNMLGTFICEDNYDITKIDGYFLVGGKKVSETTLKAGNKFTYLFSFINSKGQVVPHCYTIHIWAYNFSFNFECGEIGEYGRYDKYVFFAEAVCTKAGRYSFNLFDNKSGLECKKKYYNIIANDLGIVTFIGRDGKDGTATDKVICSGNSCEFKWGNAEGGDFVAEKNLKFLIDFKATDIYENVVDLGTTDSSNIISKLKLSVTGSGHTYTMAKTGENYQLTINVKSPGTYVISSAFMTKTYRFKVLSGSPNSATSSCEIAGYKSTPTIDSGITLNYRCILKDQDGNLIDPNTLETIYKMGLTCSIKQDQPVVAVQSLSIKKSSSYFECSYKTSGMGSFRFDALFYLISDKKTTTIKASVSGFYVYGSPITLEGAKIYDLSGQKWVSSTKSPSITYINDSTGMLGAIDLLDSDKKTYISEFDYSSKFDAGAISAVLSSDHDKSKTFGELVCKKYKSNGKTYIGIFTKDGKSTDSIIKRSSFAYKITLTLKGTTLSFNINYPLKNAGSYQTCFHDHKKGSPSFVWLDKDAQIPVGNQVQVATVILRTTDDLLYNYDIGTDKIRVTINPSTDATYTVIADTSIYGIYYVRFTATKPGSYSLIFTIDGTRVLQSRTVNVVSSKAYSFEVIETEKYEITGTKYKLKETVSVDIDTRLKFKIKDKYGNYITSTIDEVDLGISFSFLISGIGGTIISSNYAIEWIDSESCYVFVDKHKAAGTYSIIIRADDSGNGVGFSYSKVPGVVVGSHSKIYLLSSQISIGSISYVEVQYFDQFLINVGSSNPKLIDEAAKLTVITATGKNTPATYTYTFDSTTGTNRARFKATIDAADTFTVRGKYKDQSLSVPIGKNTFTASYDTYDLGRSVMSALLDVKTEMSQNSALQVKNTEMRPKFQFDFKNANGENIKLLDPSIKFEAKMIGEDVSETLTIKKEKNYVVFEYKDSTDLKTMVRGTYQLIMTIDGTQSIKYPLDFLGTEDDTDAGNGDYDLLKTFFSSTTMSAKAGETSEITVEFRTDKNKRYNKVLELSKFTFKNDLNLSADKFTAVAQKGGKNGQVIIAVTQTQATSVDKLNHLTIIYNGVAISQQVTIYIRCAELNSLTVDSSCIESGTKLKGGDSQSIPAVKFTPKDKYGNIFTDMFSASYSQETLKSLVSVTHNSGAAVTITPSRDSANYKLLVTISTQKTGTLTLSSHYMGNTKYTIEVKSGNISPKYTYAQIEGKKEGVAGSEFTIVVYPKDASGNTIEDLKDEDAKKFKVVVNNPRTGDKVISDPVLKGDHFEYTITLTESGTVTFKPSLEGTTISCSQCTAKISIAELDFKYTKVYHGDEELKTDSEYRLDSSSVPTFKVSFFDKYQNQISDISKMTIKAAFEGQDSDVEFCTEKANQNINVFTCRTTLNTNKWFYLINGSGYKLVISDSSDNKLTYNIEIFGNKNSGGSNGPLDLTLTQFESTKVSMKAGEQKSLFIELRAKDGKRKNYWYSEDEISQGKIKVTFESDSKCTGSVVTAEKPGQYYLKIQCEKSTIGKEGHKATVVVEGKEVPEKITLNITPSSAVSGYFVDKSGSQLSALPDASSDENYSLLLKLFDKYGNVANEQTNIVSYNIQPPSDKSGSRISSSVGKNGDYTFTITVSPIYTGTYTITSTFFKQYTFTSLPGEVSASNSIITVSKSSSVAGEEVEVIIIPHDKNNNYIDPSKFIEKNPFVVKSKYTKNDETKTDVISKVSVAEKDGKKVYVYKATPTIEKDNYFSGTVNGKEIKCEGCIINVKPSVMDFTNSSFQRKDPSKGFIEITDSTTEENTKNDVIYRIYPKDKYGNTIETITDFGKYTITFVDKVEYQLKLVTQDDGKQKYIEFRKNDEKYVEQEYKWETLTGGKYKTTFTDGKTNVVKTITLAGKPGDEFASNEKVDFQNTHINSQDLDIVAGYKGTIFFEIRTINNVRKNWYGNYDFKLVSCDQSDKTFSYTVDRSGTLGTYYITLTSSKANTFPTYTSCKLTFSIDGTVVKSFTPELKVSPDELSEVKVDSKYVKKGNVLIDGNADKDYKFVVVGYDQYGNVRTAEEKDISLKGTLSDGTVASLTAEDEENGKLAYTVDSSKAGVYTITSGINSSGKPYLESVTFTVKHGEIKPDNTVGNVETSKIEAGKTASITITPFDNNKNIIPGDEVKGKFTVKVTQEGETIPIQAKEVIEDGELRFEAELKKAGEAKWTVDYENKNIKGDFKTTVIPSQAVGENSVVYVRNKMSTTTYTNGKTIPANTDDPFTFYIQFKDKYGNTLTEIPSNVKIINAVMSGNDMEELTLDIGSPSKNTVSISIPKTDKATEAYSHLVQGDNYQVTFTVKATPDCSFKYPILLSSNKDDEGYGNGPYVVGNTVITPTSVEFHAGDKFVLNLILKTAKNKIYNNDINLVSDITVALIQEDSTFKKDIVKTNQNYGNYNIQLTSTKAQTNSLKISIKDPKTGKFVEINPIPFKVLPESIPDPEKTEIVTKPGSTITPSENAIIEIRIADKYGNVFDNCEEMNTKGYINPMQNDGFVSTFVIQCSHDGTKITISFKPQYPPRKSTINVNYNNGKDSSQLIGEPPSTEVISSVSFEMTDIKSSNINEITAGEKLDIKANLYDENGICLDTDYPEGQVPLKVRVKGPSEDPSSLKTYEYSFIKVQDTGSTCQNLFQIVVPDDNIYTKAGSYVITVIGGQEEIKSYSQRVVPADFDKDKFKIEYVDQEFNEGTVKVNDPIKFRVSGSDQYDNPVTKTLDKRVDVILKYNGNEIKRNVQDQSQNYIPPTYTTSQIDPDSPSTSGKMDITVNIIQAGDISFGLSFDGEEVEKLDNTRGPSILTILPGDCVNPVVNWPEEIRVSEIAEFVIQCKDQYDFSISKGGEEFNIITILLVGEIQTNVETKYTDMGNGKYTVKLIPPVSGTYKISITRPNKEGSASKEYRDVKGKESKCTGETPLMCPNIQDEIKCVSTYLDCIDDSKKCKDKSILAEKPFYCEVQGVKKCVSSWNDCDCPSGHIRCGYMKVCAKSEDNCQFALPLNCKKYSGATKYCEDGICRASINLSPNQRVCPVGYVLCQDLTCATSYDKCQSYEACSDDEVRCNDQSCVSDQKNCPSAVTCADPKQVVCPDNTCVDSEVDCKPLKKCLDPTPVLCPSGSCATTYDSCPKGIACGHGYSLCSDSICRKSCEVVTENETEK